MISAKTASSIRKRIAAYEKAREQFDPIRYERGGGYSKADIRAIEKIGRVRSVPNEQRSQLELYEFMEKKPRQLFAYVKEGSPWTLRTWMGDVLSEHITLGRPYKAMGAERIPITAIGLNGVTYHGTYYSGSGDYARLKASTRKSR